MMERMEIKTESEDNPQTTVQFVIQEVKEKRHKCSICEKGFHRAADLATHMVVHKTVKDFPCSQCPKAFASSIRVKMHEKLHQNRDPVSCNICEKTFKTTRYLKNHLRQHSERKFSCEECGDKFKFPSNLKQHILRIHMKKKPSELTTKRYICDCCKRTFYTKFNYDMHLMAHNNIKSAQCSLCLKKFRHKYNLKIHMKTHEKKKEKLKKKANLKILECLYCQETFTKKAGIRKHIEIVHLKNSNGSDSYECAICPRKFKCKKSIDEHMKIHKEPNGPKEKVLRKNVPDLQDQVKIKTEYDDSDNLGDNSVLESIIECSESIKIEYESSNFIKIEELEKE